MTGPTFEGRDDYLPDSALVKVDALWDRLPDTWEVKSSQGYMKSITATFAFPVVGPLAQSAVLDDFQLAVQCLGAVARNLRFERERVAEAVAVLADEFGHAEAVHNPRALEALAILQSLTRDEVRA